MNENFVNGFKKAASFKSMILYKLSKGLPVKMKGFSKKSIRKTIAGKKL